MPAASVTGRRRSDEPTRAEALGVVRLAGGLALGIGPVGIAPRAAGPVAVAYLGGVVGGAKSRVRRWMGLAIIPQAGVALGTALVAGNASAELRDTVLTLGLGATVVFELAGPALTRLALIRAGAARAAAWPIRRMIGINAAALAEW